MWSRAAVACAERRGDVCVRLSSSSLFCSFNLDLLFAATMRRWQIKGWETLIFIVQSDNLTGVHLVFLINYVVLDEIKSSHSIPFDYLIKCNLLSPFSFLFIHCDAASVPPKRPTIVTKEAMDAAASPPTAGSGGSSMRLSPPLIAGQSLSLSCETSGG